jgi:hypothetical protein
MWPGVKEWFGRTYKEHTPEYPDLMDVEKSDRYAEILSEVTGFGLVPEKAENQALSYTSEAAGMSKTITHVARALGFVVSYEEQQDNMYDVVGKRRSQALAFSFRQTKETVCANIYNRAFNSSYTGGDGVELCSTGHITADGTQSNKLSVDADLCQAAVEDMLVLIMTATNSKGLKINLKPQSLIVHPSDYFEAMRLYKSEHEPDTGNNAINPIRGMFPGGVKVNHYLSDSDAWFVRVKVPAGITLFQRHPIKFQPGSDYDTLNIKFRGYERFGHGWGDWRCAWGSAGA